jgi:hypothetical protein
MYLSQNPAMPIMTKNPVASHPPDKINDTGQKEKKNISHIDLFCFSHESFGDWGWCTSLSPPVSPNSDLIKSHGKQ